MSRLRDKLNEKITMLQYKINAEENIILMDYGAIKPICDFLDNCSRWRDLVAAADDSMFKLSDEERERCSMILHSTPDGSPTMELIKKWSNRGMNMKQFIYYLDKCKLETCLKNIIHIRGLSIQIQPANIRELITGDTLELNCEADGFPYPLYVWFRDGKKIKHEGNEMSGRLVIPNIKLKDGGTYCCQVQQYVNEEWKCLNSDYCEVYVQGIEDNDNSENDKKLNSLSDSEPIILTHPKSQCQHKGGITHFYVKATCPPHLKLEHQWFFNNSTIKNANLPNYKIIADIEHKGDYQVRVSIVGRPDLQVLSKIAHLDVLPEENNYKAGDKVALIIAVSAYRSYSHPLPGAQNDLEYTIQVFEEMNFKVISLLDLTLKEMKKAIEKFATLVDENVYTIMYFMGHGFLHNYLHYLVPWDAAQGVVPSECLCIENAIKSLQEQKPVILMVLLEICRRQIEHLSEPLQPNSLETVSIDLPNKVLIYSASVGEKSFEKSFKEKVKARGLFNQYLLEVLKKPDLSIMDVFTKLQERFSNCEFDREKYAQHPEMTINLSETQRSLWNPIDPKLTDPRRQEIWQLTKTMPRSFKLGLTSYGKLVFKFREHFSNMLAMRILKSGLAKGVKVHADVAVDNLEECILPIRKEVDDQAITFYIGNLQRIENNIDISLEMKIFENDVLKDKWSQCLPSFGYPLISAINNL